MSSLKREAMKSSYLKYGIIIASTAVVNIWGIAEAYNNWMSIYSRLDTLNKAVLKELSGKNDGWIAEDHEAFTQAVMRFQGELEAFRGYVQSVAKFTDDVGALYRAYWIAISRIVMAFAVASAVACAMLLTPMAANGAAWLRTLGVLATEAIALATSRLAKAIFGVAAAFEASVAWKGLLQGMVLEPTGGAKVDFTKAKIDMSDLPSFQKKPGPQHGFQWVEPKKNLPEKYGTSDKLGQKPKSPTGQPHTLGGGNVRVSSGQSLSDIAANAYGDPSEWPRIYQANRGKIANPNGLSIGEILAIPAIPE
ncbi:LysM peptidoglycan-binding domain-containing protein [Sphaerisporangium fuscum]|uniref:LysM peptidoglycan-binding domain-containing protein n=1 Tax=Sphaerisporangium fuscum TaxID=2835868 RepID=UPI001BDD3C06|nr:LysM peptidoglycan-binding domain-containing protein [Sphaerisporangium fuscum]